MASTHRDPLSVDEAPGGAGEEEKAAEWSRGAQVKRRGRLAVSSAANISSLDVTVLDSLAPGPAASLGPGAGNKRTFSSAQNLRTSGASLTPVNTFRVLSEKHGLVTYDKPTLCMWLIKFIEIITVVCFLTSSRSRDPQTVMMD